MNAGLTVNGGITVGSGGINVNSGNLTVLGSAQVNNTMLVFGQLFAQAGLQVQGPSAGFNCPVSIPNTLTVTTTNATTVNANTSINSPLANITNVNLTNINGAPYVPGGGGTIPSTLAISTATFNGIISSIGGGRLTSGGATLAPLSNTFTTPIFSLNTLTNSGGAFMNAGLSVNGGITVGTGNVTVSGSAQVGGSMLVFGQLFAQAGLQVQGPSAGFNCPVSIPNTLTVTTTNATTVNANSSINSPLANITNVNLTTINGAPYVPGGGGSIPSTILLSTVSVNGNFTQTGGGTMNVTGNASFSNIVMVGGNLIGLGVLEARQGAIVDSGIALRTGDLQISTGKLRATAVSTNTISTNTITTDTISGVSASISAITLSTINGLPANSFPSTINLSTINVNGLLNITGSGFISTPNIIAGNISTYTLSSLITRAPLIFTSTLYNSDRINSDSISTNKLSTNSLFATSALTNLITTSSVQSQSGSINQLTVQNINGSPYPPIIIPTGAVTIWAGGLETTLAQTFNIPTGWLACDGSLIQITSYPNLAAVIGTTYNPLGSSPPVGFVYLPDLTFAIPMGTPRKTYSSVQVPSGGPTIQIEATTSDSFYNTGIGGAQILTLTTLRVNTKIGGALNYGSYIPSGSVSVNNASFPGFPAMYVSSIIQYGGSPNDIGYLLLRSCDDLTPIPRIPTTSTITAVFQGVAYGALIPPGVDAPYKYGTANVEGNTVTTRNQGINEVAAHNHQGVPDTNSTALLGLDLKTGNGGFTASNYLPYVDSPSNRSQNLAYYTAPNFLNMMYIIRT